VIDYQGVEGGGYGSVSFIISLVLDIYGSMQVAPKMSIHWQPDNLHGACNETIYSYSRSSRVNLLSKAVSDRGAGGEQQADGQQAHDWQQANL